MIWKPIPLYEGLYNVSEFGDVKSLKRYCATKYGFRTVPEKILSPKIDKDGYFTLHLSKKNIRWHIHNHRLVGLSFLDNPNNYPEINHQDGNKQNNHYSNLSWCTGAQNVRHAFKTGLIRIPRGIERAFNKLSEEEVLEIRRLHETKSCKELGRLFNVSHSTIWDIATNRIWTHI